MIIILFLGEELLSARKKSRIFIVKSRNITSYNEAVEGFRKWSSKDWDIVEYNLVGTIRNADEMMRRLEKVHPDLVIAVGAKALIALTQSRCMHPVVFCMVMNPAVYNLQGFNATGVFLAVAPEEQLKVLVSLNPKIRKVGVLLRAQTRQNLFGSVGLLAQNYGVEVIAVEIGSEKEIPVKLKEVLGKVDALWMLDDSFIHTKEILDFVILKSLENELAFMAISSVFVKEGALVSLSPSFYSNGHQASQVADVILAKKLKPKDIPVKFHENPELVINLKVARKIGVVVPKEFLDRANIVYE
jgi:putative ABC transport system substrate-binding protein